MIDKMLDTAIFAAKDAGKLLKKHFKKDFAIFSKTSKHDLVTEVDFKAEEIILGWIQRYFPTHSILSEEKGAISGEKNAPVWVVDPLDGTYNFIRGIGYFCVSIAVWQNGSPLLGVVYSPMTNELFVAKKGEGAFLNDTKISVSTVTDPNGALLGITTPYKDIGNKKIMDRFLSLASFGSAIRSFGACALDLCYVAKGVLDGYWFCFVNPWDYAAGAIIIEEAGGAFLHSNNTKNLQTAEIIASNGLLQKQLIETIDEKHSFR